MADKPTEFFLGALDFFGILVPGAVLLAAILILDPGSVKPLVQQLPPTGLERTAALAVSAYLLGYALHVAGFAIDRVFDRTQHRFFNRHHGRELYNRVIQLKDAQLSAADSPLITGYRWALTNIRSRFPSWGTDVDRMTAHTALFRSMTLIAGFVTLSLLLKRSWFPAFLCAFTTGICLQLYLNLRWRSIRIVYEYYLALQALPPGSPLVSRQLHMTDEQSDN